MALSIIPTELIRPIIERIASTSTLCSLCLSSKLLRSETDPVLYRSFTESSEQIHMLFLTTIVNNHRLAEFVRVFHSDGVIKNNTYDWNTNLWTLTRLGLERMHGLKELSFRIYPSTSSLRADYTLFEHCTFALETLIWYEDLPDGRFLKILEHQVSSNLKHLSWWRPSKTDTSDVSSLAVPNLTTLVGYRRTPLTLLPGRRIRHLHWLVFDEEDLRSPLPNLSREFGWLLSLALSLPQWRRDGTSFNLIADSLRSLEYLELFDANIEDCAAISKIPHLRVLVISSYYAESPTIPVDEREMWAQTFFASCPDLKRVDIFLEFDESGRSTGGDLYERWEEGTRSQKLLRYGDVHPSGRWPFREV